MTFHMSVGRLFHSLPIPDIPSCVLSAPTKWVWICHICGLFTEGERFHKDNVSVKEVNIWWLCVVDSVVPSCATEAVSAEVSLFCRFRLQIWAHGAFWQRIGCWELLPLWQLKLQGLGTKCVASPFGGAAAPLRRDRPNHRLVGSICKFESVRKS